MSYSAAQAATIVALSTNGDESDYELIERRIKHWVVAGLLGAIGEQHPGTGNHRRYTRGMVFCAAVLNILADLNQLIAALTAAAAALRTRDDSEFGDIRLDFLLGRRFLARRDTFWKVFRCEPWNDPEMAVMSGVFVNLVTLMLRVDTVILEVDA